MPEAPETGTETEVRYKVGEVCRLADVQPYVLRYWENEFPVLAADRSLPGPRTYTERDLAVIQRIKTLLYVEGFTIAGAKKRLDAELKTGGPAPAEADQNGTAPVPIVATAAEAAAAAAMSSTSPVSPSETKSKRTRTRPVPAVNGDAENGADQQQIFEEDVTEAPPEPESERKKKDLSTGVVTPPPLPAKAATDPRLPRIVEELKKILEILSKEP